MTLMKPWFEDSDTSVDKGTQNKIKERIDHAVNSDDSDLD